MNNTLLQRTASIGPGAWPDRRLVHWRLSVGAFASVLLACSLLSAGLASWLPLQVSIVTVFLFAGPHNWFELRYFLMRLPVRFGRSRNFFLTAFAGIRVLIAVGPAQAAALQGAGLNPPVLLFTAVTALVTAVMVGIDASSEMLYHARVTLPDDRADLRVARLQDPLPPGPFDVVVSVLTVHHLDGAGKAELFDRVARQLAPGGRVVLGDVGIPQDPADAVTPIDGDYDTPSSVAEQLAWLTAAGLLGQLVWAHRDLAVLVGQRSSGR